MVKLIDLLESTDKGYTIYCDLDGVLCDFEGAFKELSNGVAFRSYISQHGDAAAWKVISDTGYKFWATLGWTKDGKELWRAIKKYKPIILSAPSQDPLSIVGKRMWVKKHLGTVKAIYVPAKRKQEYANKHSILIDDYERNISQWETKGGIAIHHTTTSTTLKKLNPYI